MLSLLHKTNSPHIIFQKKLHFHLSFVTINVISHHVCRELLLVVLGGDYESLAGVGGEPHVHLLQVVRGAVGDLRRGEVEVAELARAHHQDVRAVCAGGDAREAHLFFFFGGGGEGRKRGRC